jgi:chemotaxis-related protein WspB
VQVIVFRVGAQSYALQTRALAEIIPAVSLRALPQAPPWAAGLLCLRGATLPVVDLCHLLLNRRAAPVLSTRIMIVHYPSPEDKQHLLGLIAESVTEIQTLSDEKPDPTGITLATAPWLGGVKKTGTGTVQMIDVSKLLTDDVKHSLFAEKPA